MHGREEQEATRVGEKTRAQGAAPVKIGDTVSARVTVTDKRAAKRPGSGVLTLQCEVLNQRREIVQVGTITLLMRMRDEP